MRPLAVMLLAVAAPAWGADHELSFDLGTLVTPDASFETFSDNGAVLTLGARGAFAFTEHVSLQAGFSHARTGSDIYLWGEDDEVASDWGRAAFFANQISVGPRFDWKLWGWFVPYGRVDGLFLIADARLDDDPRDPQSPGQIKEMGFSGGFRPMLGIDFLIPRKDDRGLTAGFYVEGGYTWLSPTKFETMGDVSLRGFTLGSGLGLRL